MADINIGQITEALNNKLDRDGMNAGNPASVVVETYSNGTSWYRVYSDGWCEQGGYYSSIPADGYASITFLKAFRDTNYFFTNTIETARAIGTGWDSGSADEVYTSRSTTGTEVTGDGISNTKTHYGFFWQACGYIR